MGIYKSIWCIDCEYRVRDEIDPAKVECEIKEAELKKGPCPHFAEEHT